MAENRKERAALGIEATLEVDALVQMLQREVGAECFDLVLRSTLRRIGVLNAAVMSALDASYGLETVEIKEVVHG